ncbi:MAG TPA: hydantoinase/carbamoylase family amidase [SAR324 cluster bacterium]|jgi:N-carbamoyl-L-amino-acid hydrolase|nr:hydantoinase/carbamoylase family amidase [Deltaproteobacteria bacterium]HJL87475.1 hydantoinase/carbamoylase family amidase [SAR324 cluster bacterium]HJO44942.1 hydantoinase/carbamoylase family amidase [SAR324 cluster bacterium]|tara:strand:- start:3311 stop:4543 length:1233 start_codon:yes stop_codon:yes gene_type:complete
MSKINAERLLDDLRRLSQFGTNNPGVVRPAFSEADIEARNWLRIQYTKAGLDASIDGMGNVLGRSKKSGPALLIGSHSDSQPTGGWLDGALGVIYGLEIVRSLAEDPLTRGLAVDTVSWQDEESRFFSSLGCRSFCDQLPPGTLDGLCDKEGHPLEKALESAGLKDVPLFKLEQGRYLGYLEGHIEQGPQLELQQKKIGVVSSIVGVGGMVFSFKGIQNHAGTTMMKIRKDAATALFKLASRINEEFPKVAGIHSVWTMGRAIIHPGAPSIVPGAAELELQYRDASLEVLEAFEETAKNLMEEINVAGGATVESRASRVQIPPCEMDSNFKRHLSDAAEMHAPTLWELMPSGAFHDAGIVQRVIPCGMLFIPSIGGVSHDFSENSHDEDIVLGCQVMADSAASLLQEQAI